jgi:hypothetical protein
MSTSSTNGIGMGGETSKSNNADAAASGSMVVTAATGGGGRTADPSAGLSAEFPGMGLFWDEWARCIGSRYQADHLYRVGRLDSCARQWKDLKVAARARLKYGFDPRGAQELLDTTYYRKRTTISPTAGAIWELKDKPGWN